MESTSSPVSLSFSVNSINYNCARLNFICSPLKRQKARTAHIATYCLVQPFPTFYLARCYWKSVTISYRTNNNQTQWKMENKKLECHLCRNEHNVDIFAPSLKSLFVVFEILHRKQNKMMNKFVGCFIGTQAASRSLKQLSTGE